MMIESKKEELNPLMEAIAARKKEAIEVVAPKIVDLVSILGVRTPFGYKMERDGAIFEYNELTDIVTVYLGPNDMLGVNLKLKRCSLYKEGSWKHIMKGALEQLAKTDIEATKSKHQVKFHENFGIK